MCRYVTDLKTASSSSCGLFVAPMTSTRSSPPDCTWNQEAAKHQATVTTQVSTRWSTSTVETTVTLTPSNSTRNSVLSLREASCSPSLLSHSKLSTSSRHNMTKDEMRELGRYQPLCWRHLQPTGQAVQTNKDDGRLQFSGHCKQRPHKLLSLSHLRWEVRKKIRHYMYDTISSFV